MEEINLKNILDDIYENDIQNNDKYSFIYFLIACGAYEDYIRHINVKSAKLSKKVLYDNNAQLSYYNLIGNSLSWSDTYNGYRFWHAMQMLHHTILYFKYKKNIIQPNDRMIRLMDNICLYSQFYHIKYELEVSKTKNKKIWVFISKLKDYFNEIGLK